MKMFRKLICVALAVVLVAAAMPGAFAATRTLYMRSLDGGTPFVESVPVEGAGENSRITRVRSSDKTVLKVLSLCRSDESRYVYDQDQTDVASSASLLVTLLKVGKATLSYQVDGKKHTCRFAVKKYVNPIKTLMLTGVTWRNLNTRFDRSADGAILNLKKNSLSGGMKVKAANGWKICSALWIDYEKGVRHGFSTEGSGVSACSFRVPQMIRDGSYEVKIDLINTRTGGRQSVSLPIR